MTDTNIYNDDNSKSRNRDTAEKAKKDKIDTKKVPEHGGRQTSHGEDPTRYGDWEKNGRAIDF
jgi:hypothetical protein